MSDGDASVGPVVGVFVIVTVTVLLAAVIGAYVMSFESDDEGCSQVDSVEVTGSGDVVVTFEAEFDGTVVIRYTDKDGETDVQDAQVSGKVIHTFDANASQNGTVRLRVHTVELGDSGWKECGVVG